MNKQTSKTGNVNNRSNMTVLRLVLPLAIAMLTVGCVKTTGNAQKAPADLQHVENEPAFRIGNFVVLTEVTQEKTLPYISAGDGSIKEMTCFVPQNKLRPWQTTNTDVFEMVGANKEAIQSAVSKWIVKTFEDLAGETLSKGFKLKFKQPMIVHAPDSRIRLAENQACVNIVEGKATTPRQVVTTLFGSKTIEVTTTDPLSPTTIKAMRGAAKALGMRLQAAPYAYPRAKGTDGTGLKDEKGRPLFLAPDGTHVLRANIPKPKKRPIFDWRLKFQEPLFYAAGDLPGTPWSSETIPELCDVYLIFNDATPRVLECGRLKEAGFGISQGEAPGEVTVKITAFNKTTTKSIPFGSRTQMVASGRIVAWVTAKEVEEGAHLFVDNVVIFPDNADTIDDSALETEDVEPKKKNRKNKSKKQKNNKPKKDKPKKEKKKKEEAPPPPMSVY